MPIAVNVSPECVLDRGFPDRLERLLLRGGIPPQQLCLEIIETAAFHDPIQSADILARIRLKGVELTIDDFGTGYSSLKLLRQMPFSAIKIDRSFVIDMLSARDSAIIVKTIIDLARTMDLQSIAEGVETEAAARSLETLGVGFLQGYLTGRPMPVEQIPVWLGAAERAATAAQPPPLPRAPFAAPYLIKPDLDGTDCGGEYDDPILVHDTAFPEVCDGSCHHRASSHRIGEADATTAGRYRPGCRRLLDQADGPATSARCRNHQDAPVASLCCTGRAQPDRRAAPCRPGADVG